MNLDWDILVLTDYPVDNKKESVFRDHLYDLELETGEAFQFLYIQKLTGTPNKV